MAEAIDIDELVAATSPLRYLADVVDVVRKLNENAFERSGEANWSFAGTERYLSISWGEVLLWDTEDSRDFNHPAPSIVFCELQLLLHILQMKKSIGLNAI